MRVGQLGPLCHRQWAMAGTAVRLGLKPPATSPGPWFPREWTRELSAWRVCSQDLCRAQTAKLTPKRAQLSRVPRITKSHIYIGRGASARNLAASEWANPFKVKHNGREDAVQQYHAHLKSRIDLLGCFP